MCTVFYSYSEQLTKGCADDEIAEMFSDAQFPTIELSLYENMRLIKGEYISHKQVNTKNTSNK
jgi:hypothetical protein